MKDTRGAVVRMRTKCILFKRMAHICLFVKTGQSISSHRRASGWPALNPRAGVYLATFPAPDTTPLRTMTMKKFYLLTLLAAVGLSFSACNVEKTEEGRTPDIDVEPGKLPEYDVDPARIRVETDTQKLIVPDVDVVTPGDTIRRQ